MLLTVEVKSCSLQILIRSSGLKSLTEEVCSHQARVTTHAALSIFFFFCFHSRYLQHTLHYVFHGTFCVFVPPIVVGVLLTCQSQDPEYKMTGLYFQEKTLSYIQVNTVYLRLLW